MMGAREHATTWVGGIVGIAVAFACLCAAPPASAVPGELDTNFSGGAFNSTDVQEVEPLADGDLMVGGGFDLYVVGPTTYFRGGILRLNPNGSVDTSFSTAGGGFRGPDPNSPDLVTVYDIEVLPDGDFMVAGSFTRYDTTPAGGIARLNPDGSLDTAFDSGLGVQGGLATQVKSLSVLPDGDVLIGGEFTTYKGTARNRLARINPDGSLDSAFDPGTGPNGMVEDVEGYGEDQVVVAGQFSQYGSAIDATDYHRVARLEVATGAPDPTFKTGNFAFGVGAVSDTGIQPDGKVVGVGSFETFGGVPRARALRLDVNGTLDTSFVNPGLGSTANTVALLPDGQFAVGGFFTRRIARLTPTGSIDAGFSAGANPGANGTVWTVGMTPDGSIAAAGEFSQFNGEPANRVTKLLNLRQLEVGKTGGGSGVVTSLPGGIACGATCSGWFDQASVVDLSATAASGSTFDGWSGDCSGAASTCQLDLSEYASASARFRGNFPLSVVREGDGSGTVTSSPQGISCGQDCSGEFLEDTQVTLTAQAELGSVFRGWSGACQGQADTCTVTVAAAAEVGAIFTVLPGKTSLKRKPKKASRSTTAVFGFTSSPMPDSYRCRVDRKKWRACGTTLRLKRLKAGRHVLRVRAVRSGLAGPVTTFRWKVLPRR